MWIVEKRLLRSIKFREQGLIKTKLFVNGNEKLVEYMDNVTYC